MKISVSFDRKVGLPGYSSVGASCRIEWDADPAAEPLAAPRPQLDHRLEVPPL